jgi:hypothetical protein
MVPQSQAKPTLLLFDSASTTNPDQRKARCPFLSKINLYPRHTIAGAFAECFSPQKADAMV